MIKPVAFLCSMLLTAAPPPEPNAAAAALPAPSLEQIAENVWVHKSYRSIKPWGPILSQGMIVKTETGVFLIDTAWDDADTEDLLAMIAEEIGETPTAAVVTHAHDDKMGGVKALKNAGVETYALAASNEDAPGRGLEPAEHSLSLLASRTATPFPGAPGLSVLYPGPGHTRDNIVVYYEPAKVLFGGCLIRPGRSRNLGNTADGSVPGWADSVRNVAAAFPETAIVIPSHGPKGERALLDHTIALAEGADARNAGRD